MNTWANQRGYPIITVTRDYDTGIAEISQDRFLSYDGKPHTIHSDRWWVPINYVTGDNPNFTDTKATEWLEPNKHLIKNGSFKSDQWLIVNKQLTGSFNYHICNSYTLL